MFCTKCGAKVEDGLKFCPKCGQQLEAGDGETPQKSSKLKGIAFKVIGFILLAAAVFAYKYFTDGHSPYQIKKQTAELVEQIINKDEASKLIQFVKVEDLELEKQDANHYTGTAWVLLNRKENPAKDPMRFKYVLDVKVANDTITLEQKMHEDYVANYLIFLSGGTQGAEVKSDGEGQESDDESDDEESESDDGEADYTNTSFEESEKLIAKWHKLETGEGMTSLQKENGEAQLIGKKIAVKGWVTDVGKTFDNNLYVTATNSNPHRSQYYVIMQSNTDEVAQSLHAGDPVILCGTFYKGIVSLGLGLNHGCVDRWEDDAAESTSDDSSTEYEKILREAMPIVMAKQGVPKNKLEEAVAEELKKEMKRFNALTSEEKQAELKKAREEILPTVRAMQKGGTADISKEYEAILREAMPVAMAMQGVPKDKIDAIVKEELEKEMTRFKKLSDEEKLQELNKAKEEILKIRALKKGGAEAKAVMDELADSAAASALSMKGRNLYIAMMQTNIDREAAGLPSVWPQANASSAGKDIAEMRFKSSTEYFNILFDIPNKGRKPYVNWDAKSAISPDTKKAIWLVAQGVTDEMEDCVPVLVSSNVDPSSLIVRPGQHDVSELAANLRFTGKFAVVIRKGGSANVIKAGDATLKKVYNGESFALPKGFGYLTPERSAK